MNEKKESTLKTVWRKICSFVKKLRPRTLKIIIGGAFVILILFTVFFLVKDRFSTESQSTKLGFEDTGELATQAAYVTETNVTENARDLFGLEIPFTQSKVIFSYNVVIKAGYDFSDIRYTIDESNQIIHVQMPEAKILSSAIDPDSFMLYHDAESIFTPITVENYNEALADLSEEAETTAIENGLLEGAEQNGRTIVSSFFYQAYDKEVYTVEFS